MEVHVNTPSVSPDASVIFLSLFNDKTLFVRRSNERLAHAPPTPAPTYTCPSPCLYIHPTTRNLPGCGGKTAAAGLKPEPDAAIFKMQQVVVTFCPVAPLLRVK